jgi:hypothetical protein
MRFNTSARSKTLALSVSSIWYGRRKSRDKTKHLVPYQLLKVIEVIAASSLLFKTIKRMFGFLKANE